MDENRADLVLKGRINSFWVLQILDTNSYSRSQSEAEVACDVAFIDRAHAKPIWYDVKIGYIKLPVSSIDKTTQNEIAINEAFSKVITSIIQDEALRKTIRDFAKSKKYF
jgi:hypothetical protein